MVGQRRGFSGGSHCCFAIALHCGSLKPSCFPIPDGMQGITQNLETCLGCGLC